MQHTSQAKANAQGYRESNERLEFLGDAILGAVVADYLFLKYPYRDEGFLTELRSKIVQREALNTLAVKIGLNDLVNFDGQKSKRSYKSLYGDAMEAFIGAVYLDKGYRFTRKYIIQLVLRNYDLQNLVDTPGNYKSLIIEWAQKNGRILLFQRNSELKNSPFAIELLVDNELVGTGFGLNKKKAEQDAARKACESLGVTYQA